MKSTLKRELKGTEIVEMEVKCCSHLNSTTVSSCRSIQKFECHLSRISRLPTCIFDVLYSSQCDLNDCFKLVSWQVLLKVLQLFIPS